MMNALGIFQMVLLVPKDLAVYTRQPYYFWLGEVEIQAMLAGVLAGSRSCASVLPSSSRNGTWSKGCKRPLLGTI